MRNIQPMIIVLAWAGGTFLATEGAAWGHCAFSWTDQTPLNNNAATDSGADTVPQVTTDGAGNWVAVWESTDSLGGTIGSDYDIVVASSSDNGLTWTAPAPLNSNATSDSGVDAYPQVITDGTGNWVAVWASTDSLGGTIGVDDDILVARSVDKGLTWTAPAPLNNYAENDSAEDKYPQMTTDGIGNWVSVWHSNADLDGEMGADSDILVARSTDNGLSWTDPLPLNSNATSDSGADLNPQVTTDGTGNWIAVWLSYDSLDGAIGSDRDILIARSVNNGANWSSPWPLNTNAYTDYGDDWDPQVATDGAGIWMAVWRSNDSLDSTIGTDWDILAARSVSNGMSWTDPVPLNTNAATDSGWDMSPQVTTDAGGNWVAVWQTNDTLDGTIGNDRDILMARSVNNGVTWTDPAPVNNNATADSGHDEDPQVTTDGAGNWVAVWRSAESLGGTIGNDYDIHVARVEGLPPPTDCNGNGVTDDCDIAAGTSEDCNDNHVPDECDLAGGPFTLAFSDQAPLNNNAATDSGADQLPQLTTDEAGNWVAVWTSGDDLDDTIGTDLDILVAYSSDNGLNWTDPAPLKNNSATDVGNDSNPQVSTDGAGNWVAVWHSGETLGGTIGNDSDILVARSVDNGANWTDPAPLNNNAAIDSEPDAFPQVTTDGAGNWVAVWESTDSLGGTIGTDADILVALSADSGATWTDPAPLNNNAATDSGNDERPQFTTNRAGNWVAVWRSDDDLGGTIGNDWDILTARSDDNGATWTDPAPLNNNAATDWDDFHPQVTTDGGGNWVAVWHSDDDLGSGLGSDYDILMALSANNGVIWTDPVPLNSNAATDSGEDVFPQVSTDRRGNWVAVWDSNDNLGSGLGTDRDILVASSVDVGATWTAPATLNNNAGTDSGIDSSPLVTSDGAGNWVAVWHSDDDLGGTVGTDNDILVARMQIIPPLSSDCNSNCVPDECEVDTDGDGVIDDCDTCPNTVPGAPVDANGCPDPAIPADFDNDGDVDQNDYNTFESCSSGPGIPLVPGCEDPDLDPDNDVDQEDFGIFQRCYRGENNLGDPTCAD